MSYEIDLDPYVRCLQADLYQSCSDCRMHTNTRIGPNRYRLPYIYAAPAVDAGVAVIGVVVEILEILVLALVEEVKKSPQSSNSLSNCFFSVGISLNSKIY